MVGRRNTHGVKSSAACYGSFPAGSTVLTYCCRPGHRRAHTHTRNADPQLPVRQRHPLSEGARTVSTASHAEPLSPAPPRPLHHHPPTPHCSFYRQGSRRAGASLDKQNNFCALWTPSVGSAQCVYAWFCWHDHCQCII